MSEIYGGMQVSALLVATCLKACRDTAPTWSGEEMTHVDAALYFCEVFGNLARQRLAVYDDRYKVPAPDFNPHEFLVRCGLTEDEAAFHLITGSEADTEPTQEQDQADTERLDDLDPYPNRIP